MKRYICILLALFAILATDSCSRKTVGGFGGNYSFKTGGDITIDDTDKTVLSLPSESGQMDILENGKNQAIITMNILNGGALVVGATLEGDELKLSKVARTLDLNTSNLPALKHIVANLSISGKARKIENVIVFDLKYTGTVKMDDETYNITSSNVHQIAKEN